MFILCVFFFKQKTAYEMRISDWSSDVCSSDLATRREYADSIWLSGRLLLNIVDDVLDMSKVEAGEMVLDTELFDPVALLESCLRLIEKQAEKQGVELVSNIAGALPPAFGDERRIKQVLLNLLSKHGSALCRERAGRKVS